MVKNKKSNYYEINAVIPIKKLNSIKELNAIKELKPIEPVFICKGSCNKCITKLCLTF
jgi:hypothetical protein